MPACGADGLPHSYRPTKSSRPRLHPAPPPLVGRLLATFSPVQPCLSLARLVRPRPQAWSRPRQSCPLPQAPPHACACRPRLSPPGPAPAPPSAYLAAPRPCRCARAATLLRTVLKLARTCGKGRDRRWKAELGSACWAHGRRDKGWAPTWAKGVTIMSSPCLPGDEHQEGRPGEALTLVPIFQLLPIRCPQLSASSPHDSSFGCPDP